MKLNCNCCDGIYRSLDVHFTSACDNRCAHCVDLCYAGKGLVRPDPAAIIETILANADKADDVLFLGGEPCLFLKELVECVVEIKRRTRLKVFVTTAVPRTCFEHAGLFDILLHHLDGINLSVQHHHEPTADLIRRTTSTYDRQAFYASLNYKDKIRINLNLVRPHLSTREEVTACLLHYDAMGFSSIKLSEIQHGPENYVSYAELFGLKMPSPYAHGCQRWLEPHEKPLGVSTPVLLKRSCFLCESSLKASMADGIKAIARLFVPARNNYGVVYSDGSLEKGWV